ncbi:MAG TPA: UDP-N-acetylmuramate dehydrogenase [Anaerolineales bacterium]|nr:UDP-N-acetylmuramate dehydrogenase [Anaerolineales bacterium]
MTSRPTLASRMRTAFGDRLREGEPMSRHTSARIGGPADFLVAVDSADELAEAVREAQRQGVRYFVLGAGSNILTSDRGVRGLVIKNRTSAITFAERGQTIIARAESGVGLPTLARQCILHGASGLEWAATVPGTVGGAVVGNAGAHGSDTAATLRLATILQGNGQIRELSNADLKFGYRKSALKNGERAVVLSAEFALKRGEPGEMEAKVSGFITHRKRTQPPGASIGSMFKNPPGDYAGRLIEQTGLKGMRIGKAEISPIHANFFVNLGGATANDVYSLISLAQSKVREKFGVELELEIELVGDWGGQC